jgi:hypothetical protein
MSYVTSSSILLMQGMSLFQVTGHPVTLTQYSLPTTLTINVPVVYMAREVMILMRKKIPFEGYWKERALKIKTFWALKWQRAKRAPFGPMHEAGVPVVVGILAVVNIPAVAGMS